MARVKNIEFCQEYLSNEKMIAVSLSVPKKKKLDSPKKGKKTEVTAVIKKYTHGGIDLRFMFNKNDVHLLDVAEAMLNPKLRKLMYVIQHVNEPKPIAAEQ